MVIYDGDIRIVRHGGYGVYGNSGMVMYSNGDMMIAVSNSAQTSIASYTSTLY